VFFLNRVSINVRARWNFCFIAKGRNTMTSAFSVKLPPMVRAFDMIALDLASG